MCMSMACYSMLFHVCTFFHFVRLGQNREWNAAAFEAKSSHWSCRCSKLCTLAATLWNLKHELAPGGSHPKIHHGIRWFSTALRWEEPRRPSVYWHSFAKQKDEGAVRSVRSCGLRSKFFWRQECPVTWSSVLRLLKIFESLAASALGEDIRVLLWCSRFVTFWLWCICCAYAIGIPISSAAYCITHTHTPLAEPM